MGVMGKMDWTLGNNPPTEEEIEERLEQKEEVVASPRFPVLPRVKPARVDRGGTTVKKGLKPGYTRASYVVPEEYDKLIMVLGKYRSSDERQVHKQDILREAFEEFFENHYQEMEAARAWYYNKA